MDNRLGQQLGNYRLIRYLSRGGFAEVYLGEHVHLGTLFAIKMLRAQLAPEHIDPFRTEARTLAQLEHPNIVRLLDFDVKDRRPFLVTAYAPNGTLADRYHRDTALPLSPADILPSLKSVGAALQYAHDQQIIHRDIKPQNMFVGRHNEILLGDFGIALIAESAHLSDDQKAALTAFALYAAPELFENRAVFASDQYSLALCIYEWVCGELPFQGKDIGQIAHQKQNEPIPPLYGKVPMVSQAIDTVVLKALAREPQARFLNVQAFIDAFEDAYRSVQLTIQHETTQYVDISPSNRVGQQFGNYHLIRLLGQGAFAEVYLGEHIYLKTEAAVKVLNTRLNPEEIERFRAEARTIALLEHSSIIRLLEYDVEGGVPFLVMTYAPQGTLRQRHPKGTRLSPITILPYVKQVAAALQYAHHHRLIHRDVKPENLLLGRNGEVLLSDFGIAVIAQSTHSSQLLDVAGTAPYMAPEQIQGKPRAASDQYALAVAIYEWLCGEQPFQGSLFEVYSQHLFAPPDPLCEKVQGLSSSIERIVLRGLAKDPSQRFTNVEAFANAFEYALRL